MSALSYSSKEFGRRFRKALSVPFMLDQACSTAIQDFIKSYAASIGCNEKSILFPLLSCCAACMGPNALLELTPTWQEQMIIWTLVITPMTLHRVDVAEHIKQQLLAVQNELATAKSEESGLPVCNKFIVDTISLDVLKETLKCTDGQAIGIYNTTRSLHNYLSSSQDIEVMVKLHSGSSWFTSSKATKKLLSKTHVNFAVLSRPMAVYNSLSDVPSFRELYHDCFLTICAEENHVKFSQLSTVAAQSEILFKIFKAIIALHSRNSIVYKLSEEGSAKFAQIHDEITDKAKQLARKGTHKIFYPALSYLGRLSCVLHVLDNILEAVNWNMTVDPVTWSSEISAETVWRARQVLGYVIEQKYVLSQPTMVEASPSSKRVEAVTVLDGSPSQSRASSVRTNLFTPPRPYGSPNRPLNSPHRQLNSPHRPLSSPHRPLNSPNRANVVSPRNSYYSSPQRTTGYVASNVRSRSTSNSFLRPARTESSTDDAFDLLLASSNIGPNTSGQSTTSQAETNEPMISEVRSAGVPVPVDTALTASGSMSNGVSSGVSLTPTVSYILPDAQPDSLGVSVSAAVVQVTPQSIALMSEDDFFQSFKVQIRRILIHTRKDISLSLCVELKFAPKPTGGYQSSEQKTAMARIFLRRLETLGFGVFEGSNGSSSRIWVFKKRRFSSLGDKQQQFLSDLRVSEREYDKCFMVPEQQNGDGQGDGTGIVCLE